MTHLYTTIIMSLLASEARAYTKFHFTCTQPPNGTNFVFSPEVRGTLDILSNSLYTIFACTYTILHLNVPPSRPDPDYHGWRGILQQVIQFFMDSRVTISWMLISIIAPELILAKAGADFFAAKRNRNEMMIYANEDNVEWSLSHAFLANMDGFVGRIRLQPPSNSPGTIEIEPKEPVIMEKDIMPSSGQDAVVTKLGPSHLEAASSRESTSKSPDTQMLLGRTLFELRKKKYITKLPDLTKSEVMDRSKGALFVKILAMFQAVWNMIQIVTRLVKHLPITQLELAVIAFSWCTLATYISLLPKPKSVEVPIRSVIKVRVNIGSEDYSGSGSHSYSSKNLISKQNAEKRQRLRDYLPQWTRNSIELEEFDWKYVPNDHFDIENGDDALNYFALGGVIIGSFHAAGWNLDFTTDIEQQL